MYYREDEIQMACVNWFKYRYSRYFRLLFHPVNEGTGDARRGGRMKAMGVQPGVADLVLLVARNGYHGLMLEMKTEKGRQNAAQKQWQALAEEQGYLYAIIRSLDEFINACHGYLGPEIDPDLETLRKLLDN